MENKVNNKIKLIEETDDTPEKDFRAELAALIKDNSSKKHPSVQLLEAIAARVLKITDDLVDTRGRYLKLHSLTDDLAQGAPYDINLVLTTITHAIHECHKVMSQLERELKKAKAAATT